jgi:adenylosuccinate lyase
MLAAFHLPSGKSMTESGYQSPFSWRYGSDEMRALWSEVEKRKTWRRIWIALAEAQAQAGLVTQVQIDDLKAHAENIDIARASEIEAEIRHDLMAEVRTYAEQCPIGGGIIHLGATSMDVSDNAEAIRQRSAIALIEARVRGVLITFASQIDTWADTTCIGWTHLQPAEPTTVGYRLASYAQDLLADYADLQRLHADLRGKGIKGAVGTAASYEQLLEGTGITPADLERHVMAALGIEPFLIANQTYPRRQDFALLNTLASIASSLYRFAFDLRLLQSPAFGEWAEPFGAKQVGSSAMPFKRNPISAENMDSLGRYVATLPRVAWDNASHSLLERTLDDSANRRTIIPEAFLAVDEMLRTAHRLLKGLVIDEQAIALNMARYGVFAASERVMMAAARAGGDRQELHEVIREHSMTAWAAIRAGQPNPLAQALATDSIITQHLTESDVLALMDASNYVGTAPERARALVQAIRTTLESMASVRDI